MKRIMNTKTTLRLAIVMILTLLMLLLTACGKSEFGVTENTGKQMTVTARNAGKDGIVMVGSLEAEEGEQIAVKPAAGEDLEDEPESAENAPESAVETSEDAENASVSPETSETKSGSGHGDGERFESIIMIEGMEEAVSYEHIRNSTVGIEMDYDYELLERHSGPNRECFVSCYDDPGNYENYLEVTYSEEDADSAAAAVSETLSKDYDIIREEFMLERAGSCIRIDASADKGGLTMPEKLRMVYIIPADDGSRIATAHYSIEGAEGFGVRFRNMMHTLELIETR